MAHSFCPRCGAPIPEALLLRAAQRLTCPSCGERIETSVVALGVASRTGSPAVDRDAFQSESAPGRLQCRVAERQLLIAIPPGSSRFTRSLGCFAGCWLGLVAVFTWGIVSAEAWPAAGFASLFWLIGAGLVWVWIRGRFSATYVLVEPDRVVLKTELFGRENYREYLLDERSQAELTVAYTQNEQPVHAVSVSTLGKPVRFGTFLSQEEKTWLVERINRHLHLPREETRDEPEAGDFLQIDLSEPS